MTHDRRGALELLVTRRQVKLDGQVVPLGSRAHDLLVVLVEHRDRVLGKDELLAQVWPGQVVEESNLTVQIAALRKAIGHDSIATVSGRGYRFTGHCTIGDGADATDAAAPVAPADAAGAPPLVLPNIPSIAVLAFDNLSGDASQDYIADGIVEEIITALARLRAFFVIARNSSFVYKGRAVDIKRVGRELGVHYVLEGSVRHAGGRLRITGQLIDARDGHHVWAERFEGPLDDIFALQDQVTDRIVQALEPSIRRAEFARARVLPTSNLQAYDLGWRAMAKIKPNTGREDNDEALSLIARAVQLDPHYAQAKAMGALVHVARLTGGFGDAGDVKAGLRYAEQALAEDTDDPMVLSQAGLALSSLGFRAMGVRVMGFRYDESARAIERALELSPSLITVQYCAATFRLYLGESDASIAHWERCARISPLDPFKAMFVAGTSAAHMLAGRHQQALDAARQALLDSPDYGVAHRSLVVNLGFLGRMDEARVATRRMLELNPGFSVFKYQTVAPYRSADFRKRSAAVYRAVGVPR